MNLIEPRLLKGFRDLYNQQFDNKSFVIKQLSSIFQNYQFLPLQTPILEYADILLAKAGDQLRQQVYLFEDQGQRKVGMRFDLTVPLARFVAQNKASLNFPCKIYQIGPVFRGENPQKGRYRQFTQCDFDILGTINEIQVCEIVSILKEGFQALAIDPITIHLSHKMFVKGLIEYFNIEQESDFLLCLDKFHKMPWEKFVQQLQQWNIHSSDIEELFAQKISIFQSSPFIQKYARQLTDVWERFLQELAMYFPDHKTCPIVFDPTIVRGLDYYTGFVFETFVADSSLGSVASGGQYQQLISHYSPEEIGGIGASFGIDRLLNLFSLPQNPTKILIFFLDKKDLVDYRQLQKKLHQRQFNCEIFPYAQKLAQQFQYIEKKQIQWGIFLGDKEKQSGTFSIRHISSKTSFTCSFEEMIERFLQE